MTECTIEDCTKDAHKRTWCTTHYGRYQRHGDPRAKVRGWYRDPEDAFRARVTPDGDCLAWTGALDDKGYGNMYVGGKYVAAHRYAWERAHGPIPDGMVIDHECWNARCVNVGHLRIATHAENMRYHRGANSDSSTGIRGIWLDKGRYRTKIVLNGETVYRASFSTPEEAGAAADRERRAAYGAFAGNG